MSSPGVYEQRNAGHLLVRELAGGSSERAEQVRECLGDGSVAASLRRIMPC
jgi:2-dehydropantoate 2-reductase